MTASRSSIDRALRLSGRVEREQRPAVAAIDARGRRSRDAGEAGTGLDPAGAEPVDHEEGAVELAVAAHRHHVEPVEVGSAEGDVGGVGDGQRQGAVEPGGGEAGELRRRRRARTTARRRRRGSTPSGPPARSLTSPKTDRGPTAPVAGS